MYYFILVKYKQNNGKLIEVPYTEGISTTDIINKINN